MTDKECEEAALVFINNTLNGAPDVMTGKHIVALCHALIVTYSANASEAKMWLNEVSGRLIMFYEPHFGATPCHCPVCVAERKANAHYPPKHKE